ncbi:hypothetical protein KAJ38_00165 [Candidatus Pacearchaeota archaeon]|nr:hypothetical protein [Candidatus Pacearchaeota archaeon]
MGKRTSIELEEKVKDIIGADLNILKDSQMIKILEKRLESDKVTLEESVDYARNLMDKKVQLEDPFLDYAFYHYGSDTNKKVERIRKLFANFSKYSGQLILENHEGHHWSNILSKGYEERSISLGRLQQNAYTIEMPGRLVEAVTSGLKIFRKSDGWKDNKTNLRLNDFIYEFLKTSDYHPNKMSIKLAKLMQKGRHAIFKSIRPKGIYIDIFSPVQREQSFGPSINYDSEPHTSLIVGDKAVRHYLKNQKLEVVTKSVSSAGIPGI